MALTKTSIIKTRLQSRTGTNVRTNDDTIAPAPVAVATGGRTTGTTNDPVAVVITTTDTAGRTIDVAPAPVDLFAGRPTTGTLKDPTPPVAVPVSTGKHVPRDRDSDSNDDAKKPAAKPTKGRPKKVTPKATRKPRKPRTDPADDLVDPMANIHVRDATGVVTAGGIARAGGNDPVLADMDYSNPEQPEDPSKKRIRGFWLLFWDHPTI